MRRISRWMRAAAGLGAALILVGCAAGSGGAGGAVLGGSNLLTLVLVDSSYRPSRVGFSVAGGAPVELYGFDAVDPAAVASVLRLPGRFPQARFQPVSPSAEERETLNRFVLARGAGRAVDGQDACRGDAGPLGEEPVVLIAFCDGDQRISEGRLRTATALAPTDPEFGRAVQIALLEILPPYDPNDVGEGSLFIRR